MATFSYILEGASDKYQENCIGLDEDSLTPVTYSCRYCPKVFKTIELRNSHELEHPIKNPQLFIKGNELIGNVYTITSELSLSDIEISYIDSISINGKNSSLKELRDILITGKNNYLEVIYSNEDTPRKKVNIRICIANRDEIDKINKYFNEYFSCDDFTAKEIEIFRSATQDFNSCIEYASGIVDYLHGIMAKDHRAERIGFEDFSLKFNKATNSLKKYNTSLSMALRSIISFNNNYFKEKKTGVLVLDKAISFFNKKLPNINDTHNFTSDELIRLPVDLSTAFVADDLISHFDTTDLVDIENQISCFNRKYISLQDRSKIDYIAFRKASMEEDNYKIDFYKKKLKNDSIFSHYL